MADSFFIVKIDRANSSHVSQSFLFVEQNCSKQRYESAHINQNRKLNNLTHRNCRISLDLGYVW